MSEKKPNILFILSDQHNAKVMGHQGHPDVKTPNLDRMAGSGVRFDNAITQSPICTPSRVSFWSGQYCHNHGYYGLDGPHPGGLPNLMGYFREAGYATGAVGKLHLPKDWVKEDCDFRSGGSTYKKHLEENGLSQDPDIGWDGCASRLKYRNSTEGWHAQETIRFIEQAAEGDKPFFAYCGFIHPHSPYIPSPEFWNLYDEEKLTMPPYTGYGMEGKAPHLRGMAENMRTGQWTKLKPGTFEAGRRRKLHGYLGCVSQVDHALGEILDTIKRLGLEKDTIVVYSTDHGDYACEHDIMEKAPGICSDAITRIPFLWQWTGHFEGGQVAGELVEPVDVSATLCSLAGLDPMETSDGKDISPILYGKGGDVHRIGVTENPWSRSIRKGKYRLVRYVKEMFREEYPDGFGELYDLETDPWEMRNLYFDKEYKDTVTDMEQEFTDWLITTTRPATILPAVREINPQRELQYKNAVNRDRKIHPDRVRESLKTYI